MASFKCKYYSTYINVYKTRVGSWINHFQVLIHVKVVPLALNLDKIVLEFVYVLHANYCNVAFPCVLSDAGVT